MAAIGRTILDKWLHKIITHLLHIDFQYFINIIETYY